MKCSRLTNLGILVIELFLEEKQIFGFLGLWSNKSSKLDFLFEFLTLLKHEILCKIKNSKGMFTNDSKLIIFNRDIINNLNIIFVIDKETFLDISYENKVFLGVWLLIECVNLDFILFVTCDDQFSMRVKSEKFHLWDLFCWYVSIC